MQAGADRRGAVLAVVAAILAALLVVPLLLQFAPWFANATALAAARPGGEAKPAVLPATSLEQLLQVEAVGIGELAIVAEEAPRSVVPWPRCEHPGIAGWVADLRDDDVHWNASQAIDHLLQLPAGEVVALEDALQSLDLQQRYVAAAVLRLRCERYGMPPSAALLQVTVDGLSSRVQIDTRNLGGPRVSGGVQFLVEHTVAARHPLRSALANGDAQQRFLSAYLLARERLPEADAWAVRQLVEHLGDNRIAGDALMATHGLYRLGESAIAQMVDMRRYADEQGRALLDLILLDLRDPPRDRSALRSRRSMHSISGLYHDPAIEYQVGRSEVPTFAGW